MPMEESYLQHLESPIADLKNTGIQHRYGGAINASLFLKEFVNTDKACPASCTALGSELCVCRR